MPAYKVTFFLIIPTGSRTAGQTKVMEKTVIAETHQFARIYIMTKYKTTFETLVRITDIEPVPIDDTVH